MKRNFSVIALLLCALFCLSACTTAPAAKVEEKSLEDTMAAILTDVGELPMLMDMPLDSENFEFFAFAPYADGLTGLVSEAAMSAVAHSVVLVRAASESDAAALAETMRANADPRKWVCVEAEKTEVVCNQTTVLLVMSAANTCDAIVKNFNAIYGK